MPEVSIIVPVYNEQENIVPFYTEIKKNVFSDFELIFIDDGSTDATFHEIEQISVTAQNVKCISFSRNFGHQNALMAGMQYAQGKYIITMDGDLQDPPALIPEILKNLKDGYDIVFTKRTIDQNISVLKKGFSKLFYRLMSFLSDTHIEHDSADYKGFTQKVNQTILQFTERDIFLRGIFSWIGFAKTVITFDRPGRLYGTTKYSYAKMIKLGLSATTSFSFKPLRISLLFGSLISFLAFVLIIFVIISYVNGKTITGWASLMLTALFLGGIQLLAIGLLGEYIASIFKEIKKRPLFVIKESLNIN
jgi:polyisoprenyl-phosphate glycosyltransferase